MLSRFLLFILATAAVAPASARQVRIAASDLLADFIAEPLQAYGETHSIEFEIDSKLQTENCKLN